MVRDNKICNYDKKARGANVGLTEIIQKSLNLGMVQIERRVKNSDFLKYFINFGLSEETGIDLPNEVSQRISSLNYNIDINYATAAFGQGVSFSPIATLRALSIIANDGFLVRPHIVNEINYGEEIPAEKIEPERKRVLKLKTVEEVKKIMVDAVNNSKQKQRYQRKGYSVAAKTGTAQIADKKNGGYKKGVNIHTFFGFFPVKAKPEDRYAIILYTFEPRAKYSSETLTKPFYDIIDFLISYYNIKPDLLNNI
jgi:cell division protein FtsI/penicillin-binding protein 2